MHGSVALGRADVALASDPELDRGLRLDLAVDPLELGAVALQRFDLHARQLVLDACGDRSAIGRGVVVGSRERAVGTTHPATGETQTVERLRASDLMHEMQIDVDQALGDLVRLSDLVEQRLRHSLLVLSFLDGFAGGKRQLRLSPADTTARKVASRAVPFSKWCGRSASKVTTSPSASS
jgi:hypothetical protein